LQDRPTSAELLKGICHFLESELVPVLEEPLRFHTRVAANLLKIIEREAALEKQHLIREAEGLGKLLSCPPSKEVSADLIKEKVSSLNEELCRHIKEGEADTGAWRKEVLAHLRETVIRKLEIANPGMIPKALSKY
jgi:hypothetical protein